MREYRSWIRMYMKMKQTIVKLLGCLLIAVSAVTTAHATSSIGDDYDYKICQGDTITLSTRKIAVYADTILYDTIIKPGVTEQDTTLTRYVVNVYPPFMLTEYKELEIGKTIEWCDTTIDRAGTYERRYQDIHGCDSLHRLVVTEYVFTIVEKHIVDTLCAGNSISFGGQTLTQSGIYRDTVHFSRYDSVTILTLNVFKPDTTVANVRIPEGASWDWNGNTYTAAGVYDSLSTNRFGCDSLSRLVLTMYHVDTIDTAVIICPSTTYTWHGMTYGETGTYEFPGTRSNGDRVYYRLDLTVKEVVRIDTTFTLCDNESLSFQGKTYVNAGEYYNQYTCDSLYVITIVKYPSHLYLQTGTLDRTHPYLWQYVQDGETKTDTIYEPGTYEYTSQNPETGCNDIYRLSLTRDETPFHRIETFTICETEPFDWRGHTGLNLLGIGQTTHYYDRYRTAADQDSIYELILTVNPVMRTTRTIPFCGSVNWNGRIYTESTTIVDTLQSIQYQCDSIITTILAKGIPFVHHDTLYLTPGETIIWHGMSFSQDGHFEDSHTNSFGCDSTYTLDIILKPVPVATNTLTEYASICQGDFHEWRGDKYYNPGTYIDTVPTVNGDSLYILHLEVHPSYAWSERVTFISFPTTYREQVINNPGTYEFTYHSVYGCDSIITAYIDKEVYRDEQTVTICPGDTHIWDYDGETYSVSGKYTKTEKDKNGNDSVIHILNLTVRAIPDTYIEATICKGQPYVFGDQTLTQSGVYRHTFHKTGGCDSVVVLSLNVLSPDTTYLAIQREEGASYTWDGEIIRNPGMYFHYGTNRFGCDSVSILHFTYNQVDTIEETLTVCQNELPFVWNGIEANQTQHYTKLVQQPNGNYIYYSLHLTVREIKQIDTTFVICAGGSLSFNGETYDAAGHYRSYLNCDTLVNVHIVENQPAVFETYGTITDDHGFTWTYINHGVPDTTTYTNPGTYEFENPNPRTGCNDIYRLILTKDETSYHFEEALTICEGDDFEWQGLTNLSRITGTNVYQVKYETRAGKDSIYTLTLTVTPVERSVRTIVFCGETVWNGKTYTNSAVVYDTISLASGCYRIERINLDKAMPFYYSESKELPQGTVLHWHGQNITTDGTYYDYNTTIHGCDSIYEIKVTIIPASPETNQYAEELSSCEGDTIQWRGKDIWRSGIYVDTVYKGGTDNIDSIFTLHFTAWPAPKDTIYRHLYTCTEGASIRYNGQDYYTDQTLVNTFQTIHGCDSIVKVFLHFNTSLYLSRTDSIADTQLPYTWTYQLNDVKTDTVLTAAGTYLHIIPSEGGCTHEEELVLVVSPTYLYELDTTVCETALPFEWRGKSLQHTIGETKQYEDAYKTINNTDSIYRVNLTIVPAPKRTERISICENKDTLINGKSYFDKALYLPGVVYHDTAYKHNGGNECDSIIYYEITKTPQRHIIETRILHEGETFEWHGLTIHKLENHTYTIDDEIDPETGCEIIYQLRVVAEDRKEVTVCTIDTAVDIHPDKKYPYVWTQTGESYKTSGIYTDTIYDNTTGYISEFYSLYLTVTQPYDTTVYIHSCEPDGAVWRDHIYTKDTVFVDRVEVQPYNPEQPCDSVFHVHIIIDRSYHTYIDTTLCEYQLPLIIGRVNPDTIWSERNFRHDGDITFCGCDSIIEGHLTIIPKLDKNDSTFICAGEEVILGDLVHPAFLDHDAGRWDGKWEGKWEGVTYTEDTIVWDCDHRYFHHIIVRPSQAIIPEKTIYLCPDDSIQLFWPYDTTWFSHDTTYLEHRPMDSIWTDPVHGYTYKSDAYTCDSVTRWFIKKLPLYHKDSTAHRLLGDSIWWGGAWRYYTGTYDSIAPSPDTSSLGDTCMYIYPLHLIMDSAYYFRDTVEICSKANITHEYIWTETGYKQHYTVGTKDSIARHYVDSLITYDRRDSIYDLCVNYRIIQDTLIFDTICEDTKYRFDSIRGTMERWIDKPGRYTDTLIALNGCDSIVTLQLYVRPRVVTTPKEVLISDRELPYEWKHSWTENGLRTDSTDTLRTTGLYTFVMPSIHGCDSVDSLYLTVHQTHVFRDTIDVCSALNKALTHTWATGYVQDYTTPLADDTAYYSDTLQTRIKYDSIYVLCVNFHQTYETLIRDTICEGEQYRFDIHRGTTTIERWVNTSGTYTDTIETRYGCDSVLTLKLYVRNRVPVTHPTVHIPDTAAPYIWKHSWWENGNRQDSTQVLRASGEYAFVMPNIYGCDSIDSLSLFIHNTYRIQEDSIIICHDQTPYTWQDRNDITHTDDYVFHALTAEGYDSIRYVHIEVLPVLKTIINDTLCDGDSLQFGLTKWNQIRYVNKTGVYYDTLTSNQHGCDSIIELRLNVYDKFFNEHIKHISVADTPYIWYHVQGGDTIASDTLHLSGGQTEGYTYTFTGLHGCDSIDSLTLHVHQTYLYRDSVTICYNETPYSWEGIKDIYTTNEYIKQLRTHDGYDSIHVRYVEVLPVLRTTITGSICEGDSLRFGLTKQNRERFLYDAGIYYDTLTSNQFGCDSIIELRLNIYPKHRSYSIVDIADTKLPYEWKHSQSGNVIETELLNGAGEYVYHFTTSFGCDSIDSLTLRVHQTYNIQEDTIHICSDAVPFTWCSYNNISETGDYTFHGQTFDGYDSVRTVHINVWNVMYKTIEAAICEGSSYKFNGKDLTEQGTYVDSLKALHGCDSIVTLHLTVNKPYYNSRVEHIFEGQTVEFFGQTYDATGTYYHYGTTPTGCDSTSVLQLFVHNKVDTVVTVCKDNLPYMWVNKWDGSITPLYAAGIYRNDTTYVDGERMFFGLQLVISEPVFTIINASICQGSSYKFDGKDLTKQGTYNDTLVAANGCDSIVTLVLTVNEPYYNSRVEHIFEGQTVEFFGQTYDATGTYYHYGTTPTGCDSTSVLQLFVHNKVDTVVTVCKDNLPYMWVNKWDGSITPLYAAGIYRNDTTYVDGERMFFGLQLVISEPVFTTITHTICEGTYFKFGKDTLTEQGSYNDTLVAANGCDSIVTLVLKIQPTVLQTDYKTIYEGDSVEFHGKYYRESGIYEHKEIGAYGCDEIHQLILTVLKQFNVDTTAYVCDNELPFIWRGYEYSESGDYKLIAITDSSRVITTLHLTVRESFYGERNISICEGDIFTYKGKDYSTNGAFYDTIPSFTGCDSIIHYIISVHPTYDLTYEKHISDKQPYDFHGRTLTNSGMYEWTDKTIHGCDSMEHLLLTVHPSYLFTDTIDLCQSDSVNLPYEWRGQSISTSGTYTDSILTSYGFDSVYQLVVHIHPAYFIKEQYEIADGEILKIHGRDVSTPAVYYDTLRTINGCDSIFHIVVNLKRTREFSRTAEICQGEYYDFFGRKLTHSGNYTYTSQYKDSIVYLTLTVLPTSISEKRIVVTDKKTSYIYDGQIYENLHLGDNLFTDTLINQYGCDSIKRLIICVTTRYSEWMPMALCPGSEIKIDGMTITEAGLYTFERRSKVTGEMDSLYRVEVYDAPAYDMPVETRVLCDGDTAYFGDKAITRAGHYDLALKTIEGCDSLLHIDVVINPSYQFITTATIRDFESYEWMGKTYTEEGSYDKTWPTVDDCDSTYTLNLNVITTKRYITDDTICDGQSYVWRGKTYDMEGYYTDTVYRPETFFSAIYTLQLSILRPTLLTSAKVSEVCANEKDFDIEFTYSGAQPTTYSIYFDALAKSEGFEDVINVPFYGEDRIARGQIPSREDVIYLDHTSYVRPNRYSMRLVLDNGVCGMSRSDSLVLLVKYPSWIIEQNWDDVVAPLKKELNGGYDFVQSDWYINGVLQPHTGLGYLHNDKLREGDEVVMLVTRKGENYSIPTCPLVIQPMAPNVYDEPILVYPTHAPRHTPRITIEAPQSGEYSVYSSTGLFVTSGALNEGKIQVTLPNVCGIYFIRTVNGDKTETHKVVIY